jgi:hypothetical protein
MLPRLKTSPPHQISSYLTLTKKRISNVYVKGMFGYLWRAPLKVDTDNYTGVPELADQTYSAFSLVITESNSVKKKGQGIIDFL